MYKLRSDLYITDWFSRQNFIENKDEEIVCMKLSINAIDTITISMQV